MTIAWRLVTCAEKMHTSYMKISHTDKRVNATLSPKCTGSAVTESHPSSNQPRPTGINFGEKKKSFWASRGAEKPFIREHDHNSEKRTYLYMLL